MKCVARNCANKRSHKKAGISFHRFCILTTIVVSECSKTTPEDLLGIVNAALMKEKSNMPMYKFCNVSIQQICPPSKYSTPTGECNNVIHRSWGSRGDIFLRLLNPSYADGFSTTRTSVGSQTLPDPDSIVKKMQNENTKNVTHPHVTTMLPAWGQMLIYDIIDVSEPPIKTKCCNQKSESHFIPNDIISCYVQAGEVCKEYKRSSPSINPENCTLRFREQMNTATAFIDGSGLYGNTLQDVGRLRTYVNGKINHLRCQRCAEPGAVGTLHMILLSEHNRITEILLDLNPSWSDELIFLEARRILVAEIQHITYNEFLPVLLGEEIRNKVEFRLLSGKHYKGYSSEHRVGIFNELAAGLSSIFSTMFPKKMIDPAVSGDALISSSAMKRIFTNPHTDNKSWSAVALSILRERDHGIPAYIHVANFCSQRKLFNSTKNIDFNNLLFDNLLTEKNILLLKNVYNNVEDIDLMVGALLEPPSLASVFGRTLSCILAFQFINLRTGDRFWYENDIPPSSFSLEQLQSIRRVTLSGLVCAASGISRAQLKAFIKEDTFLNVMLPCNLIPEIDLSAWIEESKTDRGTFREVNFKKDILDELNSDLIKAAVEDAKTSLMARKRFEYEAWLAQGGIDPRSPDGTAASFSKASLDALLIANSSLIFELTSNQIIDTIHKLNRKKRQISENNLNLFSRDDLTETLQTIDITSFISGTTSAQIELQCDDFSSPCDATSPFRTLSGHCNNLRNPTWGQSLTTFSRLLPPQYEDGISRPRINSISGVELPNPRVISTLIHPDISNLHTRYSLVVMQFAQFLDHDLTMTPIHKGFHESIPSCRKCNSAQTVHPECNPFAIPSGDHYYPEVNITSGERLCFPFMRSLPGQQSLGPREQINQNTAFLDASQIYGENICIANKLRGFSGRLNSTIHPIKGKELLPQSDSHPECKSPSGLCFIAGDGRASEQPGLTAIHTTFLREHNRIVEGLRGVNPHWNSDHLYEQARKIVIAQNQHITYNEFLPRILSWNAVNLYGLKLLPQGHYKEYNPSCSPAIFNEFAAAAFRIGHSLLRPHIPRLGINHQPIDPPLLLRDGFFKMDSLLQPGILDEIMRGLVATPMETLDQFITGEVTNHLFEDRRIPFSGVDLISLNIQRARDHGIPSYNNYRALCNLKRAQNWQDLSREIPPEVITRFKKIYSTVDEIDLFPGAMTERPLQGGLVGPTLACIIGIQFRQLRKCDRFWYENNLPEMKFTEAQLAEIRKITLAKIICENLETPGDMQRAAFDLPSNFLNPRVPCHSMPQIDLSAWRENVQGCQIGNRQVRIGDSTFPSPCTSCVCTIEGPQCASLRITDCAQLSHEWPKDAILRDDVCSSQCGLALQSGTFSAAIAGLNPPPSRVSRSRSQNPFGFKLPDLTPFIASL